MWPGLTLARCQLVTTATTNLVIFMSFRGPLRPQMTRYGLHARQVAYATLYTGGSDGFVAFTAAPIASGWSEPSSRAGLSPAVDQRLFTAHVRWRFIADYEQVPAPELPTRPIPPSKDCR